MRHPLTRTLARVAAALVVVLGSGGGCKSESKVETYEVRLISIDSHAGPTVPEDRVQAIFRRALDQVPSFTVAERDQRSGHGGRTLSARLEYRELPDSDQRGRDLLVRLVLEAPEELAPTLGEEGLDVTVLLERDAGAAGLGEDLQLAADRLAAIIQARTDLARASPGAIERLLASDDPELLALTLEWIRDHPEDDQSRAAADRVAELIDHDSPTTPVGAERSDIGLLAIEALGEIGGPQHVAPLLERIRLSDPGQVHRAYDALAQLGGSEALAFLEFAARNDDEPDSRRAAEQALQRIASGTPELAASERHSATPTRGHR